MNRVCVINIAGLSGRLLSRAGGLWISTLAFNPRPMKPTFPATRASMLASMTTGAQPGAHGVIADGLLRRQALDVSLDERSNTLLGKKRFWHARSQPRLPKVALLFWSNPLAGAADIVLGAMTYGPSGISLADQPVGLYHEIAKSVGPCSTSLLRGPGASWAGASWIVSAAEEIWRQHKPDLQFVNLPGLDHEIVRHGLDSAHAYEALRVMDLLACRLGSLVMSSGGKVIITSDGGYVPVGYVGLPNVHLRQAGLLRVVETDMGEMPDLANSAAVCLVDHQVGHLYCLDSAAADEAVAVLKGQQGIGEIVPREELFGSGGPGYHRAGDRVVMAWRDAWLGYRWWLDDRAAPRAAGRWDVAGKLGYDPCELFAGGSGLPGEIDPSVSRIRASRGLIPADPADFAILAGSCDLDAHQPILATHLPKIIEKVMWGQVQE